VRCGKRNRSAAERPAAVAEAKAAGLRSVLHACPILCRFQGLSGHCARAVEASSKSKRAAILRQVRTPARQGGVARYHSAAERKQRPRTFVMRPERPAALTRFAVAFQWYGKRPWIVIIAGCVMRLGGNRWRPMSDQKECIVLPPAAARRAGPALIDSKGSTFRNLPSSIEPRR